MIGPNHQLLQNTDEPRNSFSAWASQQPLRPGVSGTDGRKSRVIFPLTTNWEGGFRGLRAESWDWAEDVTLCCVMTECNSACVQNFWETEKEDCRESVCVRFLITMMPSDLSSSCVQPRWTGRSRWRLRGLWFSRPPLGIRSAASSPGWTCEPRCSGTPSQPQLFSKKRERSYCQFHWTLLMDWKLTE